MLKSPLSLPLALFVVLSLPACVHKTEVVVLQPSHPPHRPVAQTTHTTVPVHRTSPKLSPADTEVVSSYDEKPR